MLGMLWAFLPVALAAQTDVAGDWAVMFQSDQGSFQATMTLEQDGAMLTGVIASDQGTFEIEGTIRGGALEWAGEIVDGAELIVISVQGTFENGEIMGAADYGGWGDGDWIAKRQ